MADVLSVIADVLKQDKQQKREHNKIMKEVQKKLKVKDSEEVAEEEGDKEDYMKFFAGKLKKYGVKSPSELSDEEKKKFFSEIEKDWTHDSNEEVEEKESLGKRVKARLEADSSEDDPSDDTEEPEEDEDEDPVGDSDVVAGGEPTEDELEKLADLVVQKIKDKADDEEEEEQEPEATEAESGKKEKVEINPKMEQVRNPHARATWEEALRQVYAVNEKVEIEGYRAHWGGAPPDLKKLRKEYDDNEDKNRHTENYLLLAKAFGKPAEVKKVEQILRQSFPHGTSKKDEDWMYKNINPYYKKLVQKEEVEIEEKINTDDHFHCPTCSNMHAPGECPLKTKDGKEGKLVEGQDTSWIDPHARKVERKWKSMNKSARKKWLQTMADKAEDNDTKQEILDDVLDDYGLTEDVSYLDVRGYGDEGTTTSDPDKDYGLHRFSDPKYKPAYTDKSFQTAPDKTGIGQDLGDKQSGTPKKAKGQAATAKKPAKIDPKGGMEKPAVGTKSDTPDKAVGKATNTKISPEVKTKDGVATALHKEDVDKAKDDSIEGPATGKNHKCPSHVKKEGYGYGKNISHTLSDNVVDKMNIYWYDSKEVSYMVPINEVEIVEAGYHNMKNHREKFKSTEKIAEELRKLPNPFETIKEGNGKGEHDPHDMADAEVGSHPDWPEGKKKKKKVTEKRSVAFARKFYQKENK